MNKVICVNARAKNSRVMVAVDLPDDLSFYETALFMNENYLKSKTA